MPDYLPHSSSDPFGATFPPGEGFGSYVLIWDTDRMAKQPVPRREIPGRVCAPSPGTQFPVEQQTGLEPATPTLGGWCSAI